MRAVTLISLALALSAEAHAATSKKKPAPKAAVVAPRPPPPAAPPNGAPGSPCPLDGLPEATITWDDPGYFWFMESGDVLYAGDVGGPLPRLGTTVTCAAKRVHIETIQGGANLSVMNFDLDFASVVAVEAPRRTPEAKAFWKARRALEAGDVASAKLALRPLDRADEDVAGLWVWIARLETKAGHASEAHQALRGLSLEVYGVAEANVEAARLSLAEARAQHAAGANGDAELTLAPAEAALGLGLDQVWPERERLDVLELAGVLHAEREDAEGAVQRLEFVVARDPERPAAWLGLAEARWLLKDKKGARAAYAEALSRLPVAERPPELAERCPKCG